MEVIAYTRLGHELSKEGGNVVEVVDDKEDGEADGETEDDGESKEELPKMIWPPALLGFTWILRGHWNVFLRLP